MYVTFSIMDKLKAFIFLSILSLLSQQVMAFMVPDCSMNNLPTNYSEAQMTSDKEVTPCHSSNEINIIDSSEGHDTCDSTCGNCCVFSVVFVLFDTLNIQPIFTADAYNCPPILYSSFLSSLHARPPTLS